MNGKKILACIMVTALIGIGGCAMSGMNHVNVKGTTPMTRTGGCFCGAVRYEITGPILNQTVCHCLGCKRSSGAGALPWITVKAADFKLRQGILAKVVWSNKFPKATCDACGGVRTFCPKCGTPISFKGDGRANEVDITVGSLDDLKDFTPTEDVFPEQRLPWIKPVK